MIERLNNRVEPETMDEKMKDELSSWRANLQNELSSLEQQLASIRTGILDKQSKIEAIDKLLGDVPAHDAVGEENGAPQNEAEESGAAHFTHVKVYWPYILEVLVDFGGRGRRQKVIDTVGERMGDILTPADKAFLPDSDIIRWRNRVAWQASNMRKLGFISKESQRGIWEITPKGRNWLDTNKR